MKWFQPLVRLVANVIIICILLFLPAGTWHWPRGLLFLGVFITAIVVAVIVLWRLNPEVVVARGASHTGTKGWDKILLGMLFPTWISILIVAALDDGRYHWQPVEWWICVVGYAGMFTGFGIIAWAQGVNKFFEPTVRIQTDRGHTVVQTGPYRIIRHPGYVGGIVFSLAIPLCLGSLWALIPAAIACLVLVVRTKWEDRTLQAELPGYKEYAQVVRFRLLPGVW